MHVLRLFFTEALRVFLLRRTLKEIAGSLGLAVVTITAAGLVARLFSLDGAASDVFQENGPIESVQAWIVLVAGVQFYLAALRFGFEIFYGTLLLSLGAFLAVVREIPACESAFYFGGICLRHSWQGEIQAVIVLLVAGLALWRREPLARHLRELNFFWIVPAGTAFAILVAAEVMEGLGQPVIEETLELAGYLHLLVFAAALHLAPHWFDARQAPQLSEPGVWSWRGRSFLSRRERDHLR